MKPQWRETLVALTLMFAWAGPAVAGAPPEPPSPEAAPEPTTETPPEPASPEAAPEPTSPEDAEKGPIDASAPAAEVPDEAAGIASIEAALVEERYGTAVVSCDQRLASTTTPPPALRGVCGRAYVGLGDKLRGMGAADLARKRWERALEIDPRLADDPGFLERIRTGRVPAGSEPAPRLGVGRPAPDRPSEHTPPPATPEPERPPAVIVPLEPPEPRVFGPRAKHDFGVGLAAGFDGLGALVFGFFADETIAVEVSVGLVYPVIDARVRWYGLAAALTPVVGLGMTTPLGSKDYYDLDVERYEALYELGESVHVDLGVAWSPPVTGLDVFVGVAFVTPLDQEDEDTVLFFPQLAAQVMYYF